MKKTLETRIVCIPDDFDLHKIASCGQCFRAVCFPDGRYRFVTGESLLYVEKLNEDTYRMQCTEHSWEGVWRSYFDLDRSYCRLRKKYENGKKDDFLCRAMAYGKGLRVLRQDPWEMLVTFILSQRKSIPAIARAVDLLVHRFGDWIETEAEAERVYLFPGPEALAAASAEALSECGLGYRIGYVRDAAEKAAQGVLDLEGWKKLTDQELLEALMTVRGVGKKVANCVSLFGYGRTACAPVDVWISRVIEENYGGKSPFEAFGKDAGILQQYLFYYKKHVETATLLT